MKRRLFRGSSFQLLAFRWWTNRSAHHLSFAFTATIIWYHCPVAFMGSSIERRNVHEDNFGNYRLSSLVIRHSSLLRAAKLLFLLFSFSKDDGEIRRCARMSGTRKIRLDKRW